MHSGKQRFRRLFSLLHFVLVFAAICILPDIKAQTHEVRTIRSVEFQGNRSVSTNAMLEALSAGRGAAFSDTAVQSDSRSILKLYREDGYIDAVIDSVLMTADTAGREVEIIFYITEGKPSVVREIHFSGNAAFTGKQLQDAMTTQSGNRFLPAALEKDIKALLDLYDRKGYPLAKISVSDIERHEENGSMECTPVLKITEGSRLRIVEIQVLGNTKTKEYVIRREARLRPDEMYTPDLPEKVRQRVQRLQLFSSVSVPELYLLQSDSSGGTTSGGTASGGTASRGIASRDTASNNASAGLSLRVAEGNQNSFDGIIGYMPASSGSGGYVTGLVSVAFRNLLGTGRKVSLRWYRENQNSQETEFHYTEPWFLSLPLDVNAGLFQRRYDSTYVKNSYTLNAEYMFSESFKAGVSFSLSEVFPTSGYGETVIASSRTASVGFLLQYDARDDAVTPTSGIYYESEYQTGTKKTGSLGTVEGSGSTAQRIVLDLSGYFSPVHRQVLAEELHIRGISDGSIDLSDCFLIGGATTLRGYREGQFLGSKLVWLNNEYRFLVAPRSYFYGFVDAAYIMQPKNTPAGLEGGEERKIGYGIGIRFDSAVGLLGVCIALGEGDTFSTAKLHFRLTNGF
jgi:outer membrane protein insertion porin family